MSSNLQGLILKFPQDNISCNPFNYNLKREAKVDDNGQPKRRVYYPKYKYGEASVKECKVTQNFGKAIIWY